MDSSQISMLCARLSSIISNKEIEDFDRAVQILWRLYRIVPDIITVDDLGGLIQNVLICRVLSRVANTSVDCINDATRSKIHDEIVESFRIPEDAQLSESSSMCLARTFATCSQKLILLATDENWDRVQCKDAILFQSDLVWQHISTSINDYVRRVTETVDQSSTISVTSKENSTGSVKSKENSVSSVTSVVTFKESSTNSVTSKDNFTRSVKSKDDSVNSVTSKEIFTRPVKSQDDSMSSVTSKENSTRSVKSKDYSMSSVTSKENSTRSVKSKDNSMSSVTSKENSTRSVKSKDNSMSSVTSKDNSTRSVKSKDNCMSSVTSKDNSTRPVKSKDNSMSLVMSKDNSTRSVRSKENSMSLTRDVDSDSVDEGDLVLNPFPYKFLMKREYCYEYEESEDSDSEEDDEQKDGHCSSDSNLKCFPLPNFGNQRDGPIPSNAGWKGCSISSDGDHTNGTHPSNGDQRDGCIMVSDGQQTDGCVPSNGNKRDHPVTSDGDQRNGPISCHGDRINGLTPSNDDPSGDPITTYSEQRDGYNLTHGDRWDRSDLSSDTDHTYIFEKLDENVTVIPESPRSTCEGPALLEDYESPLLFSSEEKKYDVGNAHKVEKDLNTAKEINNGTINLASTFFSQNFDKVGDDDTHLMIKRLAAAIRSASGSGAGSSLSEDLQSTKDQSDGLCKVRKNPKSVETANDCVDVNGTNFVEEVVDDLQISQNHSKGLQTKYREYPQSVTTSNNNSNKATGTIEQTSNFQDMSLFLDIAASLLNEKEDNEPKGCVDVGERQIPERSLGLVEENSELWEGTEKNPVDSDFLEWMTDNYDPGHKPSSDSNIEFPEKDTGTPIEAMDINDKRKNGRNNGSKSDSNKNNMDNHINREAENSNTISHDSNDYEAIETQVPRTKEHIDESQSRITPFLVDTKNTYSSSVEVGRNNSSNNREVCPSNTKELAKDVSTCTGDQVNGAITENCGDRQNNDANDTPSKVTSINKMSPALKLKVELVDEFGTNSVTELARDSEEMTREKTAENTACSNDQPQALPNGCSDWRMRIDKKQGRVADLIGKLQKLTNVNNLGNQKSLNVLVNTDEDDATKQDESPLLSHEGKSTVVGVNRALERSGNGVNFANQILRCDMVNTGKNKRKSDISWLVSKRKKSVGVNRARRKIRNGGNLGKNKRSFKSDIRRLFRRKKKRVHGNISQKRASEFECRVDLKISDKSLERSQKNCMPVKLDEQLNEQDSLKNQGKCATPSPPKVEIKKESTVREASCNRMENQQPNNNKHELTLETRDMQRSSGHSVTKTENFASYLASCDERENKESTVKKISGRRSETVRPDKATSNTFRKSGNRSQASFQNISHDYSYSANDETRLHVKRKRRSKRCLLCQASKTQWNSCEEQQNSASIASPKTNIQTNGFQNYSKRVAKPFSSALQDKGSQQKVSNSISNVGILPKKEVLNSGDKRFPEDSIRSPIDILNADCTAQSNRILPQPNDVFVKKSAKTPKSETPSTRVRPLTPIPASKFYSSPRSKGSSIQLSCSSSEDERRSPSIFELSGLNSNSFGGYTSGKLEWNLSPSTKEFSQESSKSLHGVEVTKRDTLDFIKKEPVEIDSNLSSSYKDCFKVKGCEQASHEQSTKSEAPVTKGHLYTSESPSKSQKHQRRRLGSPLCQCSRLKDPSEILDSNGNKRLRVKSKSELHVQSSALRNRRRVLSLSKRTDSEEKQNSEVPSSEGTSSEVLPSLEPSSENKNSEEFSSDTSDSDTSDSDVAADDDDPSYSDPYSQKLSDEYPLIVIQSSRKDSSEEANSKDVSADGLPYHKLSKRRFHIAEKKNSESSSSEDFVTVKNDYFRSRLAGRRKRRRTMKRTENSATEDGDQVTVAKNFRRGVLMDAVVYVVKL